MIKGSLFDVDGTLLDSMFVWDSVGEAYLRSIGYEPREGLNETFKTLSLYQAALYYQKEYGVTLSVDEIMSGVNSMVERYYTHEVALKAGAAQFLEALRRRGVEMCIATATDEHLVSAALERCGVSGYFSAVFTCTSVGHGKDEPAIYRAALEHLGVGKHQAVVFEDALYALRTAHEDGFATVAVYDSHEKRQDELRAIADYYLTDYCALESFWQFASAQTI